MAFAVLNGGFYYPERWGDGTIDNAGSSVSSLALDGAGKKVGWCFQARKTGTIDRIISRTGATFTSSGQLDGDIQTIDASTGAPSGTPVGTGGNVTPTAANQLISITVSASVTAGTYYAAVLARNAGSYTIRAGFAARDRWPRHCYTRYNGGAGYDGVDSSSRQYSPCFGVRYDDGTYDWYPGNWPWSVISRPAWNSGSNPVERGVMLTLPFPARVVGWWASSLFTADANIILAATDGTALLTATLDKDVQTRYTGSTNYSGITAGLFGGSTYDLVANTDYYLTMRPTSVSNISADEFTILDTTDTASMDLASGGQEIIYVSRSSGGTYTTDATKRVQIGLIFSGFSDGSGGGGSGGSNIFGGMVVS